MENNAEHIDLIRQAQAGDQDAMASLAECARVRLGEYIGRVTLFDDLTSDVVQESIVAMLRHLSALRQPEQFWPWLYKIAVNMLNRQYRLRSRSQGVPLETIDDQTTQNKQHDAVAEAISNELKQGILCCMQRLKPAYRMVLVMRCYDRMTYAEIAKVMGATEFGSRRMFFRAKKALGKHLSKNGLGKGALVLALTLYGRMSASTEAGAAGVSVTASVLSSGPWASLCGWMSGRVALSVVAVGVTIGTTGSLMIHKRGNQGIDSRRYVVSQASKMSRDLWYYYPPQAQDVIWLRVESKHSERGQYSQWYQNEQGNFFRRGNTITHENHRYWSDDLSVLRLPTDSAQLAQYLDHVEGRENTLPPVPTRRPGMTVFVTEKQGQFERPVILKHDVRDEEMFRYLWPSGAKLIDARDAMHKRGWTYFKITGHINGQSISGTGRLPFVQSAHGKHTPWVRLNMGKSSRLEDGPSGAYTYDSSGKILTCYARSSFFAGLSRPWEGLHTLDTIRRDAASLELPFTARYQPKQDKAYVTIEAEDVMIDYVIDMRHDWVDRITVFKRDNPLGMLSFEYLQEINELNRRDTSEPKVRSNQVAQQPGPGLLWIKCLVEGTLGK